MQGNGAPHRVVPNLSHQVPPGPRSFHLAWEGFFWPDQSRLARLALPLLLSNLWGGPLDRWVSASPDLSSRHRPAAFAHSGPYSPGTGHVKTGWAPTSCYNSRSCRHLFPTGTPQAPGKDVQLLKQRWPWSRGSKMGQMPQKLLGVSSRVATLTTYSGTFILVIAPPNPSTMAHQQRTPVHCVQSRLRGDGRSWTL
jgi:hypothetical protein